MIQDVTAQYLKWAISNLLALCFNRTRLASTPSMPHNMETTGKGEELELKTDSTCPTELQREQPSSKIVSVGIFLFVTAESGVKSSIYKISVLKKIKTTDKTLNVTYILKMCLHTKVSK